jgi:hypothetical protein
MPILRDSSELNSLNSAKRIVNKFNKKNFKNSEVSPDVGSLSKTEEKFSKVQQLLSAVVADVASLTNILGLIDVAEELGDEDKSGKRSVAISVKEVAKKGRELLNFLLIIKNFSDFNSTQNAVMEGLRQDLETATANAEGEVEALADFRINSFYSDIKGLLQRLLLTLSNFIQTRSGSLPSAPSGVQQENPPVLPAPDADLEGAGFTFRTGKGEMAYLPQRFL